MFMLYRDEDPNSFYKLYVEDRENGTAWNSKPGDVIVVPDSKDGRLVSVTRVRCVGFAGTESGWGCYEDFSPLVMLTEDVKRLGIDPNPTLALPENLPLMFCIDGKWQAKLDV